LNHNWRHESGKLRPGYGPDVNRIACLRGPKAKSAVSELP
jgi:hypothetical protein